MLLSEVVNKTPTNLKHRIQSCKVLLYKQLSPAVFLQFFRIYERVKYILRKGFAISNAIAIQSTRNLKRE